MRDGEGRFISDSLLGKKDSRRGAEGEFEEKTEDLETEEARSEAASSHSSISNFEFKI